LSAAPLLGVIISLRSLGLCVQLSYKYPLWHLKIGIDRLSKPSKVAGFSRVLLRPTVPPSLIKPTVLAI